MKIIIFRHGLAMERSVALNTGVDESQRPLVEKGKNQTLKMIRKIKKLIPRHSVLLSSSLRRALETAEIIRQEIEFESFREIPELSPEAPPQALAKWLNHSVPRTECVLVIGHEPQLTTFASWCLAGANESFIELQKSGVLILENENFETLGPGTAILKRLIGPKKKS